MHINTSDGIKFTHCERPYALLTPQLITQTNSKHNLPSTIGVQSTMAGCPTIQHISHCNTITFKVVGKRTAQNSNVMIDGVGIEVQNETPSHHDPPNNHRQTKFDVSVAADLDVVFGLESYGEQYYTFLCVSFPTVSLTPSMFSNPNRMTSWGCG